MDTVSGKASGGLPPAGTFMAPVRNGAVQLPPPIQQYCVDQEWSLFRFVVSNQDHVEIRPVMPMEVGEFHASLGPDGKLWLPAELRAKVQLGEQSVMLRVEDGGINMYLRKVFETLGFRPQ
jgi:hypothetical protein